MSIPTGTRLGPYEILVPIGAGGMGEVYKAKDTRLDRTVAVKVISPLIASAPELRERFEREARAVSQLNHPHICTLHDVGHDADTDYLVLEFLDGETLASRLARGSLPLDQALSTGMQICDALDKAHRAGIVHRDLKPGNIFLVRGATASAPPIAKLLDFGLAKLTPASQGASAAVSINLTSPPTVTTPLTTQGTILGTFQYMAPEQLEGDEADTRTDIWAFGCVLYEMLTGKKAFAGRTHASVISSVMASQPAPIGESLPDAPPVLDHVIRTCLAKDPAERFQTAHDLLLQLRWIGGGAPVSAPRTAMPVRSRRWVSLATVAAVAVLSAAVTWWVMRPRAAEPAAAVRSVIDLAGGLPVATFGSYSLAVSPDGRRLIYSGTAGEGQQLVVRSLDLFDAPAPIPNTPGGTMPFFSPDGAWIGYFEAGRLLRIAASGGAPLEICRGVAPFGAAWLTDGRIVFTDTPGGPLKRIAMNGGQAEIVTALDTGETSHRWPSPLPDGSFVFAAVTSGSWSEARIVVQPADGRPRRVISEAGTAPRYVDSGHLVFVRAGGMYAVPFDLARLEATGTAVQLKDTPLVNDSDGRAHYGVSTTGTLAYVKRWAESNARKLVWVARDGKVQPAGIEGRPFEHPRISPDGTRVALTVRDATIDVWTADLARHALTRITFDPNEDESPVWTPDGLRITYAATRAGQPRATYWKPADNSGPEERIATSTTHQHLSGWTPDGKTLISEEIDTTFGLYTFTRGEQGLKTLPQTPFAESAAEISPDGKWILYTSNESGRAEVYAQAFPGPGGRVAISVDGGGEARWSRDGREIFYRQGDRMMAVPVAYKPQLSPGTARMLFEGRYARIGWASANYDVSKDGRFLMIVGEESALPAQFNLVTGWTDELRRLAPPRR
jgi:eukaryotic-like serine/threonine-protein kinase